MHDIYIAGGLTRCKDPGRMKRFYEKIADACREAGFSPYLPHQHTDPREHPEHAPQDVYAKNHEIVSKARMIIAYVGEPSLGVGSELEIAKNNRTRIILHFFSTDKVSRMARGNPAVLKTITYDSEDEAISKIREFLKFLPEKK